MATNDTVSKQTLYIAVVVSLVVGALGGIIFSSVQSDTYAPRRQAAAPPPGMGQGQGQGQGLDPQQASRILALEQQVVSRPNDADAWVQLGNLYFDANRPAKAIRAYNKALGLRPNNAHVLTDLGVMYRRNGQPDEAVASFDRAIAAAPQLEQAYFNKGIVLMYDLHDVNGAVAAWEALLKVNPKAVASNGTPVSQLIEEAKASLAAPQGQ